MRGSKVAYRRALTSLSRLSESHGSFLTPFHTGRVIPGRAAAGYIVIGTVLQQIPERRMRVSNFLRDLLLGLLQMPTLLLTHFLAAMGTVPVVSNTHVTTWPNIVTIESVLPGDATAAIPTQTLIRTQIFYGVALDHPVTAFPISPPAPIVTYGLHEPFSPMNSDDDVIVDIRSASAVTRNIRF